MDDMAELASLLEAELSSNSALPLSKRQAQLIKRSLRRSDSNYARVLNKLAIEIEKTRVEKIVQGSGGELTEDELRLSSEVDSLFGRGVWIVQALDDLAANGLKFAAGSLIALEEQTAQSLISQRKVKLVIKIGDTGNDHEVLPEVQDIHPS
ncbi:MAG: hypothetical protein ACP5T5_00740 [Thermoprotei archaeon]|nr:hypothetical protein [TACK group archaeon]